MTSLINWLLVLHSLLNAIKKADLMEPEEFSPREIVQRESITQTKEIQVIDLTVESLTIFQGV